MPLKLYERPNGIFHIRGTVQGRRVDESARTRVKAEAEAIRAKLEADIFRREVYGDKAVATFAEAALSYMGSTGSTDHLTPILLKIGNRKLGEIDQAVVDRLAVEMKPRAKPATVIRQIYTPIAAVLNFASEQKLCDPVRFRKPKVRNVRIDYLSPIEAEKVLDALPDHLRRLATFYLGTGCRASEALGMEWRDVSANGHRVIFSETKSDYPRGVDLQRRARQALPPRAEGSVWLNSHDEPWHGYDAINLMLKRHMERAGLRPVHCHLFRHTWATWAYACTRDLTFLMQQGGWRSATMVMRYAHLASDDLAQSVLDHKWEFLGREAIFRKRPTSRK